MAKNKGAKGGKKDGKKSGVKLYLQAVQVMTHIAYTRSAVDNFEVHDTENPFE